VKEPSNVAANATAMTAYPIARRRLEIRGPLSAEAGSAVLLAPICPGLSGARRMKPGP
jgi:hypothetical protein